MARKSNGNGNGNGTAGEAGATAGVAGATAGVADGSDSSVVTAQEPKPKFGQLYKGAMAVQEEVKKHEADAKAAKMKLSAALKEITEHHGSGPWSIEGRTVSITARKGDYYFRGLRDAEAVNLDEE